MWFVAFVMFMLACIAVLLLLIGNVLHAILEELCDQGVRMLAARTAPTTLGTPREVTKVNGPSAARR